MKLIKPFLTMGEEKAVENDTRLERAKKADLITLPEDIEGVNCSNCQFIDLKKFCTHPDVMQSVSERMCCSFWNAPGAKREWIKDV